MTTTLVYHIERKDNHLIIESYDSHSVAKVRCAELNAQTQRAGCGDRYTVNCYRIETARAYHVS